MAEHPIEGLMTTAMNSIKDMIDVNTIIGDAIETSNGIVIIPVSKVTFGFAAGGSEFSGETITECTRKDREEITQYKLPFGGGSGAGVTINPVSFMIIQDGRVKLIPVNHTSSIDKLLDYMPDLIEKTNQMMGKLVEDKKSDLQDIGQKLRDKKIKETRVVREKPEQVKKQEKIVKQIDEDEEEIRYEYNEIYEDE